MTFLLCLIPPLSCRIAWFITFVMSLFKPRRERTMGSMRDLLFICLLFVSLKLDGVAAYTWSVVFLIPWMWFGALFLGAIVVSRICCAVDALMQYSQRRVSFVSATSVEACMGSSWLMLTKPFLSTMDVADCMRHRGGVCMHGHARAGIAWRLLAAAVVSSCTAALLHLPVQLSGGRLKHHHAGQLVLSYNVKEHEGSATCF
jgi:hypothetical protein